MSKEKINSENQKLYKLPSWVFPFACLLIVSLLVRLFILFTTEPISVPDSPSYIELAGQIAHWNLSKDNGARTPIYPLFLLMCGMDASNIRFVQMALGLFVTAVLFWIVYRFTQNNIMATIAGAFYGLNLSQVQFESTISTESLTIFFILMSLAFFSKFLLNGRSRPWWLFSSILFSSLAGLTRPLFVFLPLIFIFIGYIISMRISVYKKLLAFLPFILLIVGWSLFNYHRFGYFGPTTLAGYNLTNHSGAFIEYAPDRDAVLRDIYLKARQERIRVSGTHSMTIWRIIDQIMERTGKSYAQISKEFGMISIRLFIEHPILYARSVLISWIQFWNAPGWWRWPNSNSENFAKWLGYIWRIEKYILILCNFLFLILSLTILIRFFQNRKYTWLKSAPIVPICLSTIAVILSTSIIQALMERGENTRYGVPVQPLITVTIVFISTILSNVMSRKIIKPNEHFIN